MVRGRPEMEAVVALQPGGLLTPERVAAALVWILEQPSLAGEAVIVTAAKGVRVHDFRGAQGSTLPAEVLRAVAKL
jgi:hypothetical protein